MSTSSPIEEGDYILVHAFGDDDKIGGGDAQILSKGAVPVYTYTPGMLAPLTVSCPAVAAAATNDMAFTGNDLTYMITFYPGADGGDLAYIFMADGHGGVNVLLRPGIPVINMYVRTADGGFVDLNEHLPDANLRYGHLHQRQTRSFFRFDQSIHHLGNHCSNLPS